MQQKYCKKHLFYCNMYFIENVRMCQNKMNAAIKYMFTFILLHHLFILF